MVKVMNMRQKGFTIVELLIVVVVVAILAAITIVSYNGIQERAKIAVRETAFSSAVKKAAVLKQMDSSEQAPTPADIRAELDGLLLSDDAPYVTSNFYRADAKTMYASYGSDYCLAIVIPEANIIRVSQSDGTLTEIAQADAEEDQLLCRVMAGSAWNYYDVLVDSTDPLLIRMSYISIG